MTKIVLIVILSIIVCYALWLGIFRIFRIGKSKKRKFYSIIPSALSAPFVFGLILYSVLYLPNLDFDKTKWKQNVTTRHKMTKDIIGNKLLIGLTKNEVIELLGKDYSEPFEKSIAYNIHRPKIMFSMDHDVLLIYFNEIGIAIKVIEFAV